MVNREFGSRILNISKNMLYYHYGARIRVRAVHLARSGVTWNTKYLIDCKDSFRSGGQLLKHFRRRHADGTLKPSAKPEPPMAEGAADLPNIPEPFPSYLLSTDLARGEVLSEERHRLVGQQVSLRVSEHQDYSHLTA